MTDFDKANELNALYAERQGGKPEPDNATLTRMLATIVTKFGGESHSIVLTKEERQNLLAQYGSQVTLDSSVDEEGNVTLQVSFFD